MTNMKTSEPEIEETIAVATKLRYDLRPAGRRPAPLLIGLHGYGAHKKQMLRELERIAPEGFAIGSLQGPHQHLKEPKEPGGPLRFGFGWLTNFHPEESIAIHHQALLALIRATVEAGIADSNQVFLLGFSQSCALNYRFAFTHAENLRGVIGICGGIPGDWEESDLYKQTAAAVFHLSGTRDEFYGPDRTANYFEQLGRRAADVEFRAYDAGHEIVDAMRYDIRAWLVRKSDPEVRE
jgi:phospholipase/carboxylesterase